MSVALIGFACNFKTSAGHKLAKILKFDWYDTDLIISEKQKSSIAQLIRDNEKAFRAMEKEVVLSLPTENTVLSAGGGVPTDAETMRFIKEHYTVVWLRSNVDTVSERLRGDYSRPLHDKLTKEQLADFIARRNEIYQKYADFTLFTDGKTSSAVASEIAAIFNR